MEWDVLGVDSNILVRFFTRDEEQQFSMASRVFEQAADRSLYLSVIVLVELNWTLRRVYKRPAKQVLQTLENLVETRQCVVEDRDNVARAINLARATRADFSDALIALRNETDGCERTITFDHDACDIDQMTSVADFLS
jgi:predicted nucleic-acid-binding protein